MTIVEFDPSQFEGKDGDEKFREWLKSLTRVQLLELEDIGVIPDDWDYHYDEVASRSWPIDREFRQNYLSILLKDYTKSGKEKNTLEGILERLEPQVAGIQKKLDRLLKIFDSKEVTMTVKTALNL